MATKTIEIRLEIFTDEGWMPVIAVDNLTRGVMIDYIVKGIFEDEINSGLQVIQILALLLFPLLKNQRLLRSSMVGLNLV